MSIPVPIIGERILADWPISVATLLNRLILLDKDADQSSNDGTNWADVTGLTFPVTNGKRYNGSLELSFVVSATNQGLQLRLSCPTGNVLVHVQTYGNASPNAYTESRLAASGDATSISATDGTTGRRCAVSIVYDCTADGTFALQMRRGGTSGSTGATIRKGSGGLVLVSG